ncbi:hypothetical protein AAVH_29637 [Aphelenchoides avenae]|nr:hypothetical protein AAVH_29637 [Aphelenchus avenae]
MKKVQTDKLRDFFRERQQKTQQAGRDWHTTAILDAIQTYIQRMEEREADMREFGPSRHGTPRPRRTFCLQDGRRMQVTCADEDLEFVENVADDDPLPVVRDVHPSVLQEPTSRTPSPQHHHVNITYGEHQKKEFGKRSTPANFAPSPRPPYRRPQKGRTDRNKTPKCFLCPDCAKHKMEDCMKYKTCTARIRRLHELRRCPFCVRPGHSYDDCPCRRRALQTSEPEKKKVQILRRPRSQLPSLPNTIPRQTQGSLPHSDVNHDAHRTQAETIHSVRPGQVHTHGA